jgi:hypothetical protein
VRDHDLVLRGLAAVLEDQPAIRVRHLEAVDHHQRADLEREAAAPELQHLVDVRVAEAQPPRDLVVRLVEGPAGDEDADRHRRRVYSPLVAR